jgi:ABC-2 type transport system ATP-binding protein
MDLAISIQNLSKTYPVPFRRLRAFFRRPVKEPVEALRDVSFEVNTGEIFGLIGRNGAGKTTLTKIVATLVQPTTGSVSVRGHDSVSHDEQVRREIGLSTAEERSFYWRLTAEQNLLFFARLHGLSDRTAKQRIKDLFAKLELDEVARRRFGELSTGNKQRLAVARALLASPPVLLLDEPTRSLDPLAAARMREMIRSLAQQDPPVTILFTSHNLGEVETLCARVAIISRGRIRAIDSPKNLRDLTSGSEMVHITVSGGEKISFTRQHDDNRLDEEIRRLQNQGATIVDIETDRATLLDVLERYEATDYTEEHRSSV